MARTAQRLGRPFEAQGRTSPSRVDPDSAESLRFDADGPIDGIGRFVEP